MTVTAMQTPGPLRTGRNFFAPSFGLGRCLYLAIPTWEDPTVTEMTLDRARAGDEQAFAELTSPYRRELHVHCYRILGSVADAEDALQETLLAAWRGLDGYEQRASLRTWLYRIATNRCLNSLRATERRAPMTVPFGDLPEPTRE